MKIILPIFVAVSVLFARVTSDVMPLENGTVYEYRTVHNDSVLFVDSLGVLKMDTVVGWNRYTLWNIKDIVVYRKYQSVVDSNFAIIASHKNDTSTYFNYSDVLTYDSTGMMLAVYKTGDFNTNQFSDSRLIGRRFVESFYFSTPGPDTAGQGGNLRHDGAGFDRTLRPSAYLDYHYRKSNKCGTKGKYKLTFIEGIGPVSVQYDSCTPNNKSVDSMSHNPQNFDYYLYSIKKDGQTLFLGQKDTLTWSSLSLREIDHFDRLSIYNLDGSLYQKYGSASNLNEIIQTHVGLQGAFYLVVEIGPHKYGYTLRK